MGWYSIHSGGAMIFCSLQSGSNGNCIYLETPHVRLLFDAGISGIQAQKRLAALGRDIRSVDAVIVSHDHADHVRCAGIFHRKFNLPVYMNEPTRSRASSFLGAAEIQIFRSGDTLQFGDVTVETLPTPHDAAEGVAFVISSGGARAGILTDLGHVFKNLPETIASLDAVFIESNYDPDMLENGPYPYPLKRRIRGPRGHISNMESAQLLRECGGRLKWACLAHLSEQNNRPELALEAHHATARGHYALHAASRYIQSGFFEI